MNDTVKPELLSLPERLAALPPEVQALFANPENGTPDNISKAGCLALAQLGKDAWNAWREVFPVAGKPFYCNVADFSGVTFEGAVDFSGFLFGDGADFSKAHWVDGANFEGAQWGERANFNYARWDSDANFRCARWGDRANFVGAQWSSDAKFHGAKWEDGADFSGAIWGMDANFDAGQWGRNVNFQAAQWGMSAKFRGAQWGDAANFSGAQWGMRADFTDAQWGSNATFCGTKWGAVSFNGARFGNHANFQGSGWELIKSFYENDEHYQSAKNWSEARELAPNTFQEISFAGTHFAGKVDFSNRKFTGKTDFGSLAADYQRKRVQRDEAGRVILNENDELLWVNDPDFLRHVQFEKVPKFHGCELHQDTTFDGAEFPKASGSDEAARAYRTLKLAFNKQQAHREEQRFFKLEMKEEAKRAGAAKFMYLLYEKSSDFGFNLWRPLALFAVAWVVFAFTYGYYGISTHDLTICGSLDASCKVQWSWLEFSLAQSLPLTGFDKLERLQPIKDSVPVLVLALHKIIALACLFLAGLALRNLFRLK